MLSVGMRTFETINTKKYDLQLFFDATNLLRLEVSTWRCGGVVVWSSVALVVAVGLPGAAGTIW